MTIGNMDSIEIFLFKLMSMGGELPVAMANE